MHACTFSGSKGGATRHYDEDDKTPFADIGDRQVLNSSKTCLYELRSKEKILHC